jgi:predicted alpha-1,6-mannanase (GH76 family)
MKTAMQELIENIIPMHIIELYDIKQAIKKALEKEKEQIIDAYYGNIDGVFGYREAGEQYYNQTYNQP